MEIQITKSATRQLDKIPNNLAKRIYFKILELKNNPTPFGSIKLKGENNHRIRIGDYRVIYWINYRGDEIVVLRIKHRRDVYKD